jgi:predicted Zn-dependent peptidase
MNKVTMLAPGVRLNIIPSEKFKTVLMGVYIGRPLTEDEASLNALLSRVLDKATHKLKSPRELNQLLDDLYGSVLVSDVHKYGERQMTQVKLQMPGEDFVHAQGLLKEAVSLLNDVINHPRVIEDGFDPSIVEQEKRGLMAEIRMRIDDKASWAMGRCIETMCADEPYHIHELGTLEGLEAIDAKQLYAHYLEWITTSPIDVMVIGNFDADAMTDLFKDMFEIQSGDRLTIAREEVISHPSEVTRYSESHDMKQGRLALGYRMNVPYESPQYPAALLATVVLGYGGSSRLFKVVREREGLSYSVYARAEKFKSVMLVYAGVDFEKMDQAEALIIQEIESMKQGNITADELDIAKRTYISNLDSISDYPNSYINYLYSQFLTQGALDQAAYRKEIESLDLDAVVAAMQHFELDTIVQLVKEETHAI